MQNDPGGRKTIALNLKVIVNSAPLTVLGALYRGRLLLVSNTLGLEVPTGPVPHF
jgi:hypothetical protein